MSFPRRRQRTTTPLEDAKGAIENANNLIEDDRHQILSDSLPHLSEEDCISLLWLCIRSQWIEGLLSVLADIPVESLDSHFPLHAVVEMDMTENQMVRMMTPLLVKGCDVYTCLVLPSSELLTFAVVMEPTNEDNNNNNNTNHDEEEEEEEDEEEQDEDAHFPPLSLKKKNDKFRVSFIQTVISENKPAVLKLLLPKLEPPHLKLALIEAFGSNRRACCEKIIDFITTTSSSWPYRQKSISFAIALCCAFGRLDFLKELIDVAESSDSILDCVRRISYIDKSICYLPSSEFTVDSLTALEVAVFTGHVACAELLLTRGVLPTDEDIITLVMAFCAANDVREVAKLILLMCPNLKPDTFAKILNCYLKAGKDAELIVSIIIEMRPLEECQYTLQTVLSFCAKNCWWRGLELLTSRGTALLGRSEQLLADAEATLLSLVVLDINSPLMMDIIRNLTLFSPDMNMKQAVKAAVSGGKKELLELFSSLDFFRDVARQLKSETRCEQICKLIDESLCFSDVKMEVISDDDEKNCNVHQEEASRSESHQSKVPESQNCSVS